MKKRKIGVLVVSFLVVILISMLNKYLRTKTEPKHNDSLNSNRITEEIVASYNLDVNSMEYEGDSICLNLTYMNGGTDCEVGIVLFINGISQPYCISTDSSPSYLTPLNLTKNSSRSVSLKFKPIIGKKNQKLSIAIGSMLNPSFTSKIVYGNNQEVFFLQPKTITCKQDCDNKDLVFSDKYTTINASNEEKMQNKLFVKANNEIVNTLTLNQNKLTCTLNLYSATNEKYILSAYINHKIVPLFSGSYYAKVNTNKDKITSIPINFDASNFKENSTNGLYVIAVPISDTSQATKLRTIVLK